MWDNLPEAYLILSLVESLGLLHAFKNFERLLKGKCTGQGPKQEIIFYSKNFTEKNLLKGLFTKMCAVQEIAGM